MGQKLHIPTEKMPVTIAMIQNAFPQFDEMAFIKLLVENALYMNCKTNTELISLGAVVQYVPLVLHGSIKVIREDESGKEILLYYIRAGESCAMTLNASYHHQSSYIKAITQEPTEILLMPVKVVQEAARKYPTWQRFSFETYNKRFDEVLQVLDSVMFRQLDERLWQYLADKAKVLNTNILNISNQQIANDLGSSREVISRLIKQFETKKWLRHEQRGIIEILQKA
jgi:CRP/FNR family transcriptional regulator, anaerobic regulatory protein